MFFDGWRDLARVLVVGAIAYVYLLALLRLTGKRTIAKMNVYDFIVTVALGSTLASALLSSDVSLAEAAAAFFVLVALQYLFSRLVMTSAWMAEVVNGEPVLLFHDGQFLRESMRRERITEEEVRAAIRVKGLGSMADVAAVVLETDGVFSIIATDRRGEQSSLTDVVGIEQGGRATAGRRRRAAERRPDDRPPG